MISAAAAGGLVAAHRLAEIVVVRRVRRRAVEKGGIERRGLVVRAEQGARPIYTSSRIIP